MGKSIKQFMKYRIFDTKCMLYVDDIFYPSNQHTSSDFYVDGNGDVVEFVTSDGKFYFKNKINQEYYTIVYEK